MRTLRSDFSAIRPRRGWLIPALLAAALPLMASLTACQVKNVGSQLSDARTTRFKSAEKGLELRMTVHQTDVDAGDTVKIDLVLDNVSTGPTDLVFNSGQRFDVIVQTVRGVEVHRWSNERLFTLATGRVRLDPGQQISETVEIAFPPSARENLESGQYDLIGLLTANLFLATPPVAVTYESDEDSGVF
ncbi:MAG: BsuPI-related putative proteinase inhibitor [Sumerlaeia bacterium]